MKSTRIHIAQLVRVLRKRKCRAPCSQHSKQRMLKHLWENMNEAQSFSKNKVLSNCPDHSAIKQATIPHLELITSLGLEQKATRMSPLRTFEARSKAGEKLKSMGTECM